ncbi:glycosyl transferase [Rhizocola hellebori]|uniref:Glycosyl transferase n=1 Tax=Rhizocola hellebori TaxID=1392758 RepID=A0A8J3QD74_9ACTN|nr:glycosyl transferase [Rhizocola hellebori]
MPPYFDVPPSAYGGVEAVVADLADGLVDRGEDVTLIGAGKDGTKARLRTVWESIIPERLGEPYPEVMHAMLTRRAVEDLVAAREIDVVHDHTFSGPLNAAVFAQLGLPMVITVHGPLNTDLRRYYRALGTDVSLIAISDRQRSMAPELNWIGTVHNSLRPAAWPFASRKDDYALFLGRFHPDKGVHLAVQAAHEANMPLVLAGKCSEPLEKRYFAEQVEPLLGPNDKVVGIADATLKRKLLVNARCLLFPVQWEEPFGMVMIEAMVCGTPVVALRGGAVPEVVVDGVTGFIRERPEELPAAMHALDQIDPAACRHHVEQNFSAPTMAAGYAAAYRLALKHSKVMHATARHTTTKRRSLVTGR